MTNKVFLSFLLATLLAPLALVPPSLSKPSPFDADLIVQNSGDPSENEKVDSRSEATIVKLNSQVQPYARKLVKRAALNGIQIKVIGGFRTHKEQDVLYCQGRNISYCNGLYKIGAKVTNAKGGYSNHNFGIAFDVGVFNGSRYLPESPKYNEVGKIGKEIGLEWGGDWTTIKDRPHFQLRPKWATNLPEKQMLEELRRRTEKEEPFYP
jgi:peptidoglycan LD-endopeptidase CwlK